jgi:mannose-6-phosphate isomerase-like protein (cupin superfamily)
VSPLDPPSAACVPAAEHVQIGGFGTTIIADGDATAGDYALIVHTLGPGLLGAPPHRHGREDELSYVLEGTLSVWRDGVVTQAGPGEVVRKPRGEWHAFWNAGAAPVRFVEVISPAAFAGYFRELAALIPDEGAPDMGALGALAARYGMEFDFAPLPSLLERYGVRLG